MQLFFSRLKKNTKSLKYLQKISDILVFFCQFRDTVNHSPIRTRKMRFLGLITEVFRERRGASHNYSYAHNYSYRGDQVFLTTYSTGMVNIFLSLETQTICLLTLDECIFSQLFASTSISTDDREVELNNSIPRRPVTPFFWFLSSSWIHFILHLQEKWHVRSQGEQDKCLDCIDKHVSFRSSHRFVDVISWLTHEGNVST